MVRGGQANTLLEMGVGEPIKQHPGLVQVTRTVKVKAPGRKYLFLRPTIQEVVDRYNAKFRPRKTTM